VEGLSPFRNILPRCSIAILKCLAGFLCGPTSLIYRLVGCRICHIFKCHRCYLLTRKSAPTDSLFCLSVVFEGIGNVVFLISVLSFY
jgi:hypothetical protein